MLPKKVVRLVLGFVLLSAVLPLLAQDSILKNLQDQGFTAMNRQDSTANVKSLSELHNWFTCRQMELYRKNLAKASRTGSPDLLVPVGIYLLKKNIDLKSRWEMKINYVSHLKTTNVGVGYYRQLGDSWFVTPYGIFGGGAANVANINTSIKFNVEVGADVGYYLSSKLALVAGGLYSWVDPEPPSTGVIKNGTGISIYAGGKYFLSNKKEFSINLMGGQHFWSGFGGTAGNIMPPNFYVQGGFSLYRSASMKKIWDNKWRPVELGLFACPTLSTANLKVLAPYTLREELSIAPFISYGEKLNNKSCTSPATTSRPMSYSAAAGLELRLFGKNLEKYINPYIGAKAHAIGYKGDAATGAEDSTGYGWSAYIGTRMKIIGNISLDINVGRSFWGEKAFPTTPDELMLNGGIVFALGKKRSTEELSLHGKVLMKRIDPGEPFPPMTKCKPLTEDMLEEYDGEIRTYAYREAETTIFGNLTDLSFIDYFGTAFKFQETELWRNTGTKPQEYTISVKVKQSPKKVVVMLNSDQIDIDKLKRADLYLCFTDYDKNRYFGYYYDHEGELQPEYLTEFQLGDTVNTRSNAHNIYMGGFDKYTAKLDWVDNYRDESGLIGPNDVKTTVLGRFMGYHGLDTSDVALKNRLMKKYEFMYAVCDTAVLRSIEEYLAGSELGYAVLAAKDFNRNGLFEFKEDGSRTFDPRDDFVYSNHEKAKKFETMPAEPTDNDGLLSDSTLRLDNFQECGTDLSIEHIKLLEENRNLVIGAKEIRIIGYYDASKPTPECTEKFSGGNPEIAKGRALSVARYLQDIIGVDLEKIEIELGEQNPNRPKCPTCRRVDIEIIAEEQN